MNQDQTFFQESDDQLLFQEWQESVELNKSRMAEPYASVIDAWNEFNESKGVRFNDIEMNGMVRFQVDELWKTYPDIETFRAVFREAAENPFKSGQRLVSWQFAWVIRPKNFKTLLDASEKNNYGIRERFIPKSEWDPDYHPEGPVDWDPNYTPQTDMSDMEWWEEAQRQEAEFERNGGQWDVNDDANFYFDWQLEEKARMEAEAKQQAKEA